MNIKMTGTILSMILASAACTQDGSGGSSGGSLSGDQGTSSNPVVIGNAPISNYSASVGAFSASSGTSYYRVDNIVPTGVYTITLSNVSGNLFRLSVFDDSGYSTVLCYGSQTVAGGDASCSTDQFSGTVSNTSLYFTVDNLDIKTVTYDISVGP